MKRGALVIGALLLLFGLAWAALQALPVSDETKAYIGRKLTWGFALAIATAFAVVGLLKVGMVAAFAAAAGVLVLTGTYLLVADLLHLPGGTPGPKSDGRPDGLPDPCVVGPYMAGGRAYLCNN